MTSNLYRKIKSFLFVLVTSSVFPDTRVTTIKGGQPLPAVVNSDIIKNLLAGEEDHTLVTVLASHGFGGLGERAFYIAKDAEPVIKYFLSQGFGKVGLPLVSKGPGRHLFAKFNQWLLPRAEHYFFDLTHYNLKFFNYRDAEDLNFMLVSIPNLRTTSLAQGGDIERLKQAFDSIKSPKKILTGASRGAATCISMLGAHPDKPFVDALILECPFATIQQTTPYKMLLSSLDALGRAPSKFLPVSLQRQQQLLRTRKVQQALSITQRAIPNHDPRGKQPIDYIETMNNKIPILLIHSRADKLIPYENSRQLCAAFLRAGFQDVYYVEPATGPHGRLLWHGAIGTRYRDITHKFLQAYNLPHTAAFAARVPDRELAQYKLTPADLSWLEPQK